MGAPLLLRGAETAKSSLPFLLKVAMAWPNKLFISSSGGVRT